MLFPLHDRSWGGGFPAWVGTGVWPRGGGLAQRRGVPHNDDDSDMYMTLQGRPGFAALGLKPTAQ